MLTGLEIAGLVLASLPFLIEACKHYNETKSAIDRFRHKKEYVKKLIRSLQDQKILIENDLTILLRQAGHNNEGRADMTRIPHLLAQNDVVEDVKTVLGEDTYEAYVERITDCGTAIIDIAKRLKGLMKSSEFTLKQFAEAARMSRNSDGCFEFRARVRVSLNLDDMQARISELNESTIMMERLRISGSAVEEDFDSVAPKSVSRSARFLERVRAQANWLYHAIAHSWLPGCHGTHEAYLYLEPRPKLMAGRKEPFQFRVHFTSQLSGTENHPVLSAIAQIDHLADLSPHHGSIAFSDRQNLSESPRFSQISNICLELNQEGPHTLYLSENMKLYRSQHTAQVEPLKAISSGITGTISLKDLIDRFSSMSSSARIDLWKWPQRMTLAYELAISAMQLCSTPWLLPNWSNRNVFFYKRDLSPGFTPERAFLVKSFVRGQVSECNGSLNPSREMLELGILLLEIWNGTTLEAVSTHQPAEMNDVFEIRRGKANDWLNKCAQDMLPPYLRAVSFCIQTGTTSTAPSADWANQSFCRQMFERVVTPLWLNIYG